MSTVFLYCAVIGGTILVLQFALLVFGFGGDTDVGGEPGGHGGHDGAQGGDVGHDQSVFLKLFSLQTVSTFLTFFGLVGLGTEHLGWTPTAVIMTASAAGALALWLVMKMMRGLSRLHSQGNLDLKNAIGHTGSVYLRVPPAGAGHGRVMMQVQGRTVECRAISRSDEIATGATVRVIECTDDDVLVVELAN